MATVQRRLDISLPLGPLGLSLQSKDGLCLVAQLDNNASAHTILRVGDVIVSMNGIRMKEVYGGASGAWATLFSAFETVTRNLIVLRSGDGDGADDVTTEMATMKSNDSKTTWAANKTTENAAMVSRTPSRKNAPLSESMRHNSAKRPRTPRHDAEKSANAPSLSKSSIRNGDGRANIEIISLLDDESDAEDEDAPSNKDGGMSLLYAAVTHTRDNSKKAINIDDDNPEGDEEEDDVMEVSTSSSSSQLMRASSTLSSSSSLVHRGQPKDDRDYATDNSGQEDQAKLTIVDTKEVEEEDDVMEVSASAAPYQWMRASSSLSSSSVHRGNPEDVSGQDDQAELTIVATKGKNALVDFPHSRENCATYPFATSGDNKMHCSNCYCYVCDVPSSDCVAWTSHCEASHKDMRWRLERVRAKHQAREKPIPSAPTTHAAVAVPGADALSRHLLPASSDSRSPSSSNHNADYSVRKLLEQMTTVHPVEMQPSVGSGFVTPLRHYQKQSLAFMVDTERTASRGGWLCDEVGMGKSAVVFALVAMNPAIQSTLMTKQRIVDMVERFQSIEIKCEFVRLAKEQLREDFVDATEGLNTKIKDDILRHNKLSSEYREKRKRLDGKLETILAEAKSIDLIKLKTTVVFTSVSLMGQWEDEAKKHAPGLIVKTFHGSRKKYDVNSVSYLDIPSLSAIDVVISTSTFRWPTSITKYCVFHRVVQDECHLFGKRSAQVEHANAIMSPRRWGVSATPMSTSTRDLQQQLSFIDGSCRGSQSLVTGSLSLAMSNFQRNQKEQTFNHVVDLLRTYMIRHTKSQQINGEKLVLSIIAPMSSCKLSSSASGSEALCLPPSTSSTIFLTMSRAEENAFNFINYSRATFLRHSSNGTQCFTAERVFHPQMSKILTAEEHSHLWETYGSSRRYIPERLTKVVALRRDLTEQRRTDPTIRAVVFTQFLEVHKVCVRSLQRDGFDVYEFTGSSSTTKRDEAIRNFQDTSSRRPAVFVVTLRTGNVGITLTAASRVYLLEPCLDPSVEVQAAGRIHRLGQNKSCHVVKFVFNKSYESNIIDIHREILAGRISIVDGFVPPKALEILARGLRFRQ